jgi:hypothetical protein
MHFKHVKCNVITIGHYYYILSDDKIKDYDFMILTNMEKNKIWQKVPNMNIADNPNHYRKLCNNNITYCKRCKLDWTIRTDARKIIGTNDYKLTAGTNECSIPTCWIGDLPHNSSKIIPGTVYITYINTTAGLYGVDPPPSNWIPYQSNHVLCWTSDKKEFWRRNELPQQIINPN